ncbi:MAG: hypothetical protein GXO62_06010, partial [Epsilonproteobacteria bacterium]|nr:hypothetical protein [Campylobacterota bacterium]
FEIDKRSNRKDNAQIFMFEGVISQHIIAAAIENIEKIEDINISSKLATLIIELAQNIMNYSKDSRGVIDIKHNPSKHYYEVKTTNIITEDQKNTILPRLQEVLALDKKSLRKKYRELRKTGKHTHEKGGGIGFYEIARNVDTLEYNFSPLGDMYVFEIKARVNERKK